MEKILKNKFDLIRKDIDIYFEKIDNMSSARLMKLQSKIDRCTYDLGGFEKIFDNKNKILDKLLLTIENSNPEKISKMGYSKVFQNNEVVNSISNINYGNASISMIDGEVECQINTKKNV